MSSVPVPPTFAADIVAAGFDRNPDAAERVNEALAAAFSVKKADLPATNPTADVLDWIGAPTHPTITPLLDYTFRPGLTDSNPVIIPGWLSDSSLAAGHTEGTAPADGSFALQGGALAPNPISGRIRISREVMDQATGSLASEMIWERMLLVYRSIVEQRAASVLDALVGFFATVPSVGTGAALVADFLGDLRDLAWGADSAEMTQLVLGTTKAKALDVIGADGRRLIPVDGNRMDFGTHTGRVATDLTANSYLIQPGAFVTMATPPQRLEFESSVESVEVVIWGYSLYASVPGRIVKLT